MNVANWMPTDSNISKALGLPTEENIITDNERRCVNIGAVAALLRCMKICNDNTIMAVVTQQEIEAMLKEI